MHMQRLVGMGALLLCALAGFGQKKPVTLETLLRDDGNEFATDIQWRPDSAGFSFKRADRLRYFDVSTRQISDLPDCNKLCMQALGVPEPRAFEWQNRGVRERTTQWCSDNRHILISTRGDLFWMDTKGDSITQLTKTLYAEADPQLSPDCKYISFRKDYDLYVLLRENGYVRALTTDGTPEKMNARLDWVYPEELQIPTAHWWSPDSRHIAYLQFDISDVPSYPHGDYLASPPRAEPERYPKAGDPNSEVRLAIVDAQNGKRRFVDLGPTRDHLLARVNWLPDGKRLAVQRLNRIQNMLELIFVDSETLQTEVILTEKDEHWVNLSNDFTFLPTLDAFLWTSENTGFRHIYLYFLKERYARQLTEGQWAVDELLGVNEAETEAYYLAMEKSPLERHVYALSLETGKSRRITPEEGTWSANFSPNGASWVGRHSSVKLTPNQQVLANDGKVVATITERDEAEQREFEILPTEFHTFPASDGTTLHARLIRPAKFVAGRKYPVIVQVYGGPHAQNVRNGWAGANMDQVYAHNGFVIWQVDNRGTSGRGHKFETAVARKLGIVELEDQLTGIAYLKKLGFIDEKRIGVNGWSYGGFMTLNCLLNAPDVFRAGISGAPVVDWRFYDTIYTERYMDVPSANEGGYAETSLIQRASNLKGALLLVHNLWDDNVHFQNALHMADALQKAGKPFQMMVYPQKAHGVRGKHAAHMRAMMLDFFERELKGE